MTVEKPKPKQVVRPITTMNGAMNQSQFLAIPCNSLKAREKLRVLGAIGFGFASHWLKNWRDSFKPITKRSNHNHVITFDRHLKTALNPMKGLDFMYYYSFLISKVQSVAFVMEKTRRRSFMKVLKDFSILDVYN